MNCENEMRVLYCSWRAPDPWGSFRPCPTDSHLKKLFQITC